MAVHSTIDLIIAYMLDLIIGDPIWLPHPVRFIGWLIKTSERVLRRAIDKMACSSLHRCERIAGKIMAAFVVLSVFAIVYIILRAALSINMFLYHAINIYFIYSSFAAKCLGDEAKKVYRALKDNDAERARYQLSMLVSRDTSNLDEKEIIRGVVETTSENTVDGVLAPIMYASIGSLFGMGAPLVYAYKAISTLDSMVGYMNEKYINFGRASAKLDDYANYIPARLSGLLIPAAAFLCGKNYKKSFAVMLRDRRNHKSPNSAYPESATAGALGIRLGGDSIYFGQIVKKPTIGDAGKELEASDIADTVKLMYVTSLLGLVLCVGLISFLAKILVFQ